MTDYVYLLAVFTIAYTLVENPDFEWIREKILSYATYFNPIVYKLSNKLISCIMCVSFWVGLILGYFIYPWYYCPLYAFACYGTSLIISRIILDKE